MESDNTDYVSQIENLTDTQSNNSSCSTLSDPPDIIFYVSNCIDDIIGYNSFSFNCVLLCKQGLAQIAKHTRACHSQFWGLGNGECITCTAIICLLCHICYLHILTCIIYTGNREAWELVKVVRTIRAAWACGERAGENGQLEFLLWIICLLSYFVLILHTDLNCSYR
jgi:hypothetical protein